MDRFFTEKRGGSGGQANFRPIDPVNYRALRLIVERAQGGGLAKKRELEKIDAAYRSKTLVLPESETEDQRWWRCEARFMLGEYADWGGWQYRDKWAAGVWFTNPFRCPVWLGGTEEQTVYVVGEQGIGDEILFAGMIPELCRQVGAVEGKAGGVILEVQEKLHTLLGRSFEAQGLKVEMRAPKLIPDEERGEGFRRIAQEPEEAGATAWVTLGELARVFRRWIDRFPRTPYLKAQGEYHGRTLVSWRGAQGSIPLETMLRWYPEAMSVQYDQSWEEEIERPEIDLKDDIEGLAALLAGCDRLVTVSTSVAHIAAALGVKTDVVLADSGTGRRSGLFPWKWWCDKLSKDGATSKSAWYGDHVTVYKNWRVYENEIRVREKREKRSRDDARKAA